MRSGEMNVESMSRLSVAFTVLLLTVGLHLTTSSIKELGLSRRQM